MEHLRIGEQLAWLGANVNRSPVTGRVEISSGFTHFLTNSQPKWAEEELSSL